MIQDIAPHIFHNEYRPMSQADWNTPVLSFDGTRVLIRLPEGPDSRAEFPTAGELEQLVAQKKYKAGKQGLESLQLTYVFAVDETEYFLDCSGMIFETDAYTYREIRTLRLTEPNVFGMITFTGYHLYQWYMDNAYCGTCGTKTVPGLTERVMHCEACGRNIYPRIMPAVIVAVTDGDRLLVTKYSMGYQFYALVAGFTEIGETLEETVRREVLEETGLHVSNIRYYKSQPWGIANDILVGFFCDVEGSTEVQIDETELKLAEWKQREEIELQPDSYSLTNEMMRIFKEGKI